MGKWHSLELLYSLICLADPIGHQCARLSGVQYRLTAIIEFLLSVFSYLLGASSIQTSVWQCVTESPNDILRPKDKVPIGEKKGPNASGPLGGVAFPS